MTKLRIAPDGTVRSLWTAAVDWGSLGRVSVRRASYVEFCSRKQKWYVQAGEPRSSLRAILQKLTGRPCGEILFQTKTREDALAWEQGHFEPGGPGWCFMPPPQ